jgi:hypothetical protein
MLSNDGRYIFFTRNGRDHYVFRIGAASIPALDPTATPSQEIK